VRAGTNPVVNDIYNDLDFDGMPNGDEIRLHTDPRSDDASHRSRSSYRYQIQKQGNGIEDVGLLCTTDAECPQKTLCKEGYCRCQATTGCSTNTACKKDADCTYSGEGCVAGKCQGKWQCQAALSGLKDTSQVCAARKNITCYRFQVENISLVTPGPAARAGNGGWNRVMLYFGEAPFDKPTAYGNFIAACVDAWYNEKNGAKRPVTGKLTVPQTAWKDPGKLGRTYRAVATSGTTACGAGAKGAALYCSPGHVCLDAAAGLCQVPACVCPEGTVGLCASPAASGSP
jgi:hypothetical protein